MRKLFEKFYGGCYSTIAELIFGYLLLFICLPFVLPYWLTKRAYININKKHGFSEYNSDPNNLTLTIVFNMLSGLIFFSLLLTSTIEGSEISLISAILIPILFSTIVVPLFYFIANIRLDYKRKPKEKRLKNQKLILRNFMIIWKSRQLFIKI